MRNNLNYSIMKQKEYTNESLSLLKSMFELEAKFESIVLEYYKNYPDEKGNKNDIFYIEYSNMIYSFKSTVDSMRMTLDNPDLISIHDMK